MDFRQVFSETFISKPSLKTNLHQRYIRTECVNQSAKNASCDSTKQMIFILTGSKQEKLNLILGLSLVKQN